MVFQDRGDAGRRLAERLANYKSQSPIVFALPRGGVPVAYEIATRLHAPLEILVARKLGAPGQPELGIGAIADGVTVLNESLLGILNVSENYLAREIARETLELQRRQALYGGGCPPLDIRQHTVILVDDGLATGITARAAVRALNARNPKWLVLAVPVCATDTAQSLREEVDELICLPPCDELRAISLWYRNFEQTTDDEVLYLLNRAREQRDATISSLSGEWHVET